MGWQVGQPWTAGAAGGGGGGGCDPILGYVTDGTLLNGVNYMAYNAANDIVFVIAGLAHRLTAVDVSDPTNPTIISSLSHTRFNQITSGLAYASGYCYLIGTDGTSGDDQMVVIDVSNPAAMSVAGFVANVLNYSLSSGVTADGTSVWSLRTNRLVRTNVSNPAAPTFTSNTPTQTGSGNGKILRSGNYLYITKTGGGSGNNGALFVIDVSGAPTQVGIIQNTATTLGARGIVKDGNTVYVAGTNHVGIIDVTTPSAPSAITDFTDVPNSSLNASTGIAKNGNRIYVAAPTGGPLGVGSVAIADVTTPSSPSLLWFYDDVILSRPFEIIANGDIAYVTCTDSDSVVCIDTTCDPPCRFVSIATITGNSALNGSINVAKNGNYLYLIELDGGLAVVDVTTPASPSHVGTLADTGGVRNLARGIANNGSVIFVTSIDQARFTVFSAATPSSPTVTATIGLDADLAGARDMIYDAGYCYISCGAGSSDIFTVVDVSTPASPAIVGSISDSRLLEGGGLDKFGDLVFAPGFSQDRLNVIDVSTPSSPTIIGSVTDATNLDRAAACAVDETGNYVFVCLNSTNDHFTVVDVSTPTAPTVVASIIHQALNGAVWMKREGDLCYVMTGRYVIIDVSNPLAPFVVSGTNSVGAGGFIVEFPYIYTANGINGGQGLRVMEHTCDIGGPSTGTTGWNL